MLTLSNTTTHTATAPATARRVVVSPAVSDYPVSTFGFRLSSDVVVAHTAGWKTNKTIKHHNIPAQPSKNST